MIVNVETTDADRSDQGTAERVHDRLEERKLLPDEHFVDTHYMSAEAVLSEARDHGVLLRQLGQVRLASEIGMGIAAIVMVGNKARVLYRLQKVTLILPLLRVGLGGCHYATFRYGSTPLCSYLAFVWPVDHIISTEKHD